VRSREQLPQGWAATQMNLGNALDDLAGRSEGPQAAAYLAQSVAAYRSALQVYTREQLPQDWAATQDSLGIALDDLAGRSEGPQAAAYLEESVAAFRSALEVRTEANFPVQWIQTMSSLARTYEIKKDWANARQSYEQLLHHDPGNTDLQSKIKELTDRN
jgi:tetratricopeptide (TPR) repeat protein